MSNTAEIMALYKRRKCYAKSKYKACYKKKYGKEPSNDEMIKWEKKYKDKKAKFKKQYGLDTFYGRLNALLIDFDISRSELANTLFVSISTVDKWCTGRTYPCFSDLIAISDMFDVTTDYLLKGE